VEWGEVENVGTHETNASARLNAQLQQLHQLLIDPIAELLPADPTASVIFIPQDELFLVPFAALQDADGTYLIDRHTILTAPAIQVLASTQAQQQQVRQANLQDMLVIGDPTMPPLSLVPGAPPEFLQPLPGAEAEAIAIAHLLDTAPLLGDAATKSTVVQQMPNARIIHLATHGILDESQGLNGGVVLAAAGTGEFNEGLLTAAEIAQMDLHAELVVLSACNTGQGRITGDGVIGLSRSLVLAGVPSVVVSLWAVPDAPTGELMVEFYRQLEQTDNKAQALRQAMLNIREEYPDPIAWAAFTLIGEAE
jgi:CHAT domain-containing protein